MNRNATTKKSVRAECLGPFVLSRRIAPHRRKQGVSKYGDSATLMLQRNLAHSINHPFDAIARDHRADSLRRAGEDQITRLQVVEAGQV